MAKGNWLGVWRGKLGNSVGYYVKNSADKDRQGWRPYQPKVANPQTVGQIEQRVKLQAVNNLYRALKGVITRGWENHAYGDESRRAFYRKALGADFVRSYIPKGSTLAVPIKNVPIMYGSLTPVTLRWDDGNLEFLSSLALDGTETISASTTIGDLSSIFIKNGYLAGDQVTMVGCSLFNGAIRYQVISFFVDESDTRRATSLGIVDLSADDDYLTLRTDQMYETTAEDAAMLISVSRDGDGAHLRSTAEFCMAPGFEARFYNDAEQDAAAKRSYKKTSTTSTNWEQVPGDESEGGGSTVSAFTISGSEITPSSLTNVANEPAKLVDSNSQQFFLRAHTSAGGTRYLYGGGSDFMSSTTAPDGATNANTIDPCAANNVASGFRAWLLGKGVSADLLVIS